jgi:hypothetical protein
MAPLRPDVGSTVALALDTYASALQHFHGGLGLLGFAVAWRSFKTSLASGPCGLSSEYDYLESTPHATCSSDDMK